MTIQVTITHTNVGYPKNVRVRAYHLDADGNQEFDEHVHAPVIKGGESATFAVYDGRLLAIEETTDVADSDKQSHASA